MDEWLTLEQIAEELKMHIETVRDWVRTKKLVAYRPSRDYRVKRSDLDAFLAARRNTNEQPEG